MEHRDAADSLLVCIKQGEGAQGDVGCVPGRQLKPSGFVLETACRILLHQQAHEPGLKCGGRLGLVASLIALKELLVVSASAKRFRRHFKELESCCVGPPDLSSPITDNGTIREWIKGICDVF
jgi:hypothetical protein